VSPANVPSYWNIGKWKNLPRELFVDSGTFSLRGDAIPPIENVLERQLFIANGWPSSKNLYFSHPDLLLPLKSSFNDANDRVALSLARAKEYFHLLSRSKTKATPIGVIHGFDEETVLCTYCELKDIGYRHFALGSLGIRLSRYKKTCIKSIRTAQQYGVKPLHLFGVTLPLVANQDLDQDLESFDTSSPSKLGFYGTVLYGKPLKRYVIAPDSKQKFRDGSFTFRESITNPLPCKCPICKLDPQRLVRKPESKAKINRTIHNYFQIKWELQNTI
jgi:queuine/archaeosine tRNA-ribosyltransferase